MGALETEKLLWGKGHHHSDQVAAYTLGKVFSNYTSDRGLIPKLFEEHN